MILRCPYRRLASAYLDKLTGDSVWRRRLLNKVGEPDTPLTFRSFVELLQKASVRRMDHHWAPQIDFLVYRQYDDVFCLENYEAMRVSLAARIGLVLHDTRSRVAHGLDKFTLIEGEFTDVPAREIGDLRAGGQSPGPAGLYNDAVRSLVENAYAKDLGFYRACFGDQTLLFDR